MLRLGFEKKYLQTKLSTIARLGSIADVVDFQKNVDIGINNTRMILKDFGMV